MWCYSFLIKPLSYEVQPIVKEPINTWRWEVTPQKSGNQTLLLNVQYILEVNSTGNSQIQEMSYPTEQKAYIYVDPDPLRPIMTNWKWIIGTSVTLVLGSLGFYTQLKKK